MFKEISLKEYQDLVENKNRIFNLTPNFSSPEIMNKYMDDSKISKKIETIEKQNEQNKNLSKVFDQNLNKYFPKKQKEKNLDIIEDDVTYSFNSNMEIINSFINLIKKQIILK